MGDEGSTASMSRQHSMARPDIPVGIPFDQFRNAFEERVSAFGPVPVAGSFA